MDQDTSQSLNTLSERIRALERNMDTALDQLRQVREHAGGRDAVLSAQHTAEHADSLAERNERSTNQLHVELDRLRREVDFLQGELHGIASRIPK